MSSTDEKGGFTADISQDAINEALKAVEKREKPGAVPSAPVPAAPQAAAANPPAAEAARPPEPAPAPKDAKDAEIEGLKAEVEFSQARGRDLMTKLKDEHEKMLRAAADLENYKRRAQKEKEEVQKYGSEKLLKDFLPVFDNLERGLEHAKTPADFESLRKGVEMIRRLFEDTLGKHGVKAFSAKGLPFDPNRHEAMSAAESADLPPNHVHTEVLRGFTLNDRLVRPALVIVSRAPEAAAAPAAPAPATPVTEPGTGGGTSS